MRVARLWSHVSDGVPVLDDRLGRAGGDTPTEGICGFLQGGSEVLRAPGLSEDWLDPSHPLVVPIGFRTDGVWLWSVELAFYLREHGILPENDFVAHMTASQFLAPPASPGEIRAAEELLRGEPAA